MSELPKTYAQAKQLLEVAIGELLDVTTFYAMHEPKSTNTERLKVVTHALLETGASIDYALNPEYATRLRFLLGKEVTT